MNGTRKKTSLEEDDNFDIQKLIARVLDHWILFTISLVACIVLSVVYIWRATPLYNVHAQILVKDDQNTGGSASFLGSGAQMQQLSSLFGIKSNVYDELGILETRDLIEKVVNDMALNITYFNEGFIKSAEMYQTSPFKVDFIPQTDSVTPAAIDITFNKKHAVFHLSSSDINLDTSRIKFGDTIVTAIGKLIFSKTGSPFEGESYSITVGSPNEKISALSQLLEIIIPNDQANIISLTLSTNIPRKGEDILQKLIDVYIQRNLNEKNKISDSTLAFIKERVAIVAADLNNIEANIQGFKQKNKLADIDEQSKALVGNASEYYNKLNDVDVQLNIVKTMLTAVKEDTKRPVPALIGTDPNFVALVQKYNELITQRDKLLVSTTETNPLVKSVQNQLVSVRDDMIKNLENQQNALQATRANIVSQNAVINNLVSNVPVQERQYIDLSRERDVKQALYLFLLQQEETTAITKASNIPSASMIAIPKSEYRPYFPSKYLILAIGVIAGLGLPFAYIMLKYLLNRKIESKEDITDNTNCTILAEIGHSSDVQGVLNDEHSRTVLAEQFRIFRTNMEFLISAKKCPKILFTSTMTGEGKTFVSVNLAQIYAYAGKKVLLIEMDLRKPKLSAILGLSHNNGFTNYIISDKDNNIHSYIKPYDKSKNIFVLSAGPIPPNPAELLMSPKLNEMFEELENSFDTIIIDSPPIGAVADSQIISRFSDINLYIIRQGYSFKGSLEIVNDIIDNNKFPNLYLVVNDVKKGASYHYGYGYSYGYGYGYTEKQKSKKLF